MATNITVITGSGTTTYTVNVDRRGPVGPAGEGTNAITSETTSDGTAALYLDSLRFETTNGGPTQTGQMAWESVDGSIDAMLESGVIAAIAEDGLIRVRNTSGVAIAKGDALRFIGTAGASGRLEVGKWVGANVSNAKTFMGFAACAMNDNSNGYAQWFGKLEDINTTGGGEAWIDGQIIYAVPGTSATITDTAPTAAGEYVVAAAVINAGSGTSGSLFVRPSFAKNIASADIVDASSAGLPTDAGKVAIYDATGGLFAQTFHASWSDPATQDPTVYDKDGIRTPAATIDFPTTGSGTLMLGSNNLSDLSSASTARTNLGAGTAGDAIFQTSTYTGTGSARKLMGLDTTDKPSFAGATLTSAMEVTGSATVGGIAGTLMNLSADGSGRIFATSGNTPYYHVRQSTGKFVRIGPLGIGYGPSGTAPTSNLHMDSTPWVLDTSFSQRPGSSVTPANNGDLVFEATSNTEVTVKLKGSDGVVRSVVLALT